MSNLKTVATQAATTMSVLRQAPPMDLRSRAVKGSVMTKVKPYYVYETDIYAG